MCFCRCQIEQGDLETVLGCERRKENRRTERGGEEEKRGGAREEKEKFLSKSF